MANVEFFGLIYSIVLLIFTTRVLRRELSASVTLVTLSEFISSLFQKLIYPQLDSPTSIFGASVKVATNFLNNSNAMSQ